MERKDQKPFSSDALIESWLIFYQTELWLFSPVTSDAIILLFDIKCKHIISFHRTSITGLTLSDERDGIKSSAENSASALKADPDINGTGDSVYLQRSCRVEALNFCTNYINT